MLRFSKEKPKYIILLICHIVNLEFTRWCKYKIYNMADTILPQNTVLVQLDIHYLSRYTLSGIHRLVRLVPPCSLTIAFLLNTSYSRHFLSNHIESL